MATKDIAKDRWHSFFEEFTKAIQGRRQAGVEVVSLGYGDQVLAANAPLHGLSYDTRSETFEVEMEGIDHRVTRPRNVFVEWEAGGVVGVEIVGDDDVRTIVKISEPLMLPQPQGA